MRRLLTRIMALAFVLLFACGAALAEDYYIEVDKTGQIVTVFLIEDGKAGRIVRQMICSTGDDTPDGVYQMPADQKGTDRKEWYYTLDVYVKWPTRIIGDILFHSIPFKTKDDGNIDKTALSLMGTPASHGCIRLYVEDALWIAQNCRIGSVVGIYERDGDNAALRAYLTNNSYTGDVDYESFLAGNAEYEIGTDVEAILADIASRKFGIVNISNNEFLNIRAKQDFDSDLAGYVGDGAIVEVLEYGKKWSRIRYKEYEGYISTAYIVPMFG